MRYPCPVRNELRNLHKVRKGVGKYSTSIPCATLLQKRNLRAFARTGPEGCGEDAPYYALRCGERLQYFAPCPTHSAFFAERVGEPDAHPARAFGVPGSGLRLQWLLKNSQERRELPWHSTMRASCLLCMAL